MYNPGLRSYSDSQFSAPGVPKPFKYEPDNLGGLTDYERELRPIYQAEMEKETSERNWMRPLQFVLDRLQTGQYISANVANVIAQAARGVPEEERQTIFEAVTTGLTGEVKGSYENVLRDTLGVGQGKVFGNAPEGTRRAQMDWADVLGFVGDVLLDPLTYMTFGGATKGATKAAGEFADDTVRLYMRQLAKSPDDIFAITGKSISPQQVEGVISRGTDYARKWFEEHGGDSLAKIMQQTYDTAYRQGLRRTQEQLQESVLTRFGEEFATPIAQDVTTRGAAGGLDDITQRLLAGSAYQDAGTTFGARVMGKELAVAPERGVARVRRNTWDRFANAFRESRPGKKAGDWVWAVMNKGPVGEIRKMMGFRNPYQKYLRAQELTQGKVMADVASNQSLIDAFQPLKDLSDDEVRDVLHVLARREAVQAEKISDVVTTGTKPSDRLVDTLFRSGNEKVDEAADKLRGVFDRWNGEEARWATAMGENPANYREWYVPEKFRYRQGGVNPRRQRQRTYLESYEREKNLVQEMYDVDDQTARQIMEADASGLGTNFKEALAERALIHGRAKARHNLVQQIREMGIDLRDSLDPAADLLRTRGRDFKSLGMKTVDNRAFDGFVFDADVADIAERTIDITGKHKNLFTRSIKKYAQWWKGVVTSTTGFHARNFMSNTMTQFLKHGGRAFNPKEIKASAVAVAYAMDATNPKRFLDELGISEQWMRTYENMRFGNLTLKELAQEARKRGVISESTMGFSGEDVVQKISATRNKITMESGPVRNMSRQIGNYVENIPRFQSFLIDYMDTASKNIGDAINTEDLLKLDDPALNYAAQEAKKWFLDYTDLTDFEQQYMKNIIPFYCVPDDSEALTREGWKRHGEISVGDEILTYNMDTGKQEWQPVQQMNEFAFDGELEVLAGKQGTYRCTANHKWPVETTKSFTKGKWYGGEQRLVETTDLKTNHILKLAAETDDQDSILSPREAALLGWLVTDGYFRWRGNHFESMIYQKKGGSVNIIRELAALWITSESVHPDTGVICFRLSNVWAMKVNQYFKSKDDLPSIVTRLSNKAALAMWESMMLAEGHVNPHKHFKSFAQTPGPVLDAFQILSQILGKPFGYSIQEAKSKWSRKQVAQGYIRERKNLKASYLKRGKEEYRGLVWCPTVDNHTWVMRQNGKVIITGNSWLRKNLANQISGVVLYPELYSLIPKIEGLVEYEDPDYDPSVVPEWMREEAMFPIAKTEEGFRFFRPDFAYKDLNLIPLRFQEGDWRPHWAEGELKKDIINATAPWLKDIASRMTTENGYNFFYREELNETGDAPYLMRLLASRPGTIAFIDGFMRMLGSEDGAKLHIDTDGKLQMDGQMAQTLSDYLPVLRQAEFLFYLPQTVVPGLEETIERVTMAEDQYEGAEQAMQMLSYYLGVKTKEVDLEREQSRLATDIYYRARDILTEQRSQRPGSEQRSLDYRQRIQDSIRRLR